MVVVLRRLLWIALVCAAAGGGYSLWQRRNADENAPIPEWPPFVTDPASPNGTANWIEPVQGECPLDYPIKANGKSRIFHAPGGTFYDRTNAQRCYARAEDAEADGYRAARA